MLNYYDEDGLFVQELGELEIEDVIENLYNLTMSGYKLNQSQREHLICAGVDPDTFENLDEPEMENFLQVSKP